MILKILKTIILFNMKPYFSLVKNTNKILEIDKRPKYINSYIKEVIDYSQICENRINDLELSVEHFTYDYISKSERLERVAMFIEMQNYVKIYNLNNFIEPLLNDKIDFIPWSNNFMKFVFKNKSQLKKRMTIEQSVLLGDKFDLLDLLEKEFKSLKELHDFKIT